MVAYRLHLHESFLTAIEVARFGRLGEPRLFTSLFVEPIPAGDARLRKGAMPLEYISRGCTLEAGDSDIRQWTGSWDHRPCSGHPRPDRSEDDLLRDRAYGLIGPHLFSEASLTRLLDGKYTCVLWNSVPGDWRDLERWVERCLAEVLHHAWSAVVLHDFAHDGLDRLPELLHRLQDSGAVFRQDFPDDVIVTRGGQLVNLSPDYVADWIPREAAYPAS